MIESQLFILGPEVSGLEAEVAEYCDVAHGVGCASGSDALLLPLMALGVGPGDEVITTPYTFFATAGSIWRTGARPVFVDIEPETYNIDPARIEDAITPRTKVIIPVHLFGQAAEMDPIMEIARAHGLTVLEDAAQAIGAAYQGRRTGGLGHVAAFSFYPSKNLGGFGDAGHGHHRRRGAGQVGGSAPGPRHGAEVPSPRGRLQLAARRPAGCRAPGQAPPPRRPGPSARREAADRYRRLFREAGLADDLVTLPVERPGHFHVYNQFVIRVPALARDRLRAHLAACRVGTEIYYPIPLHLQACFASLGHQPGDFPHSEAAARETLALPMYPELTEEAQRYVVSSVGGIPSAAGSLFRGKWASGVIARRSGSSRQASQDRSRGDLGSSRSSAPAPGVLPVGPAPGDSGRYARAAGSGSCGSRPGTPGQAGSDTGTGCYRPGCGSYPRTCE